MAVSKRTSRRLAPRERSPVRTAEVVTPWTEDPHVRRLTEQIVAMHTKAAADLTATVVNIGARMFEVRKRLEHGEWLRWLHTGISIKPRTVQQYLALFEWSRRAKPEFVRFKHIGPTKLYVLAAAKPAAVRKLPIGKAIRIPGGGRKTIDDMTIAELSRVVGGLTTKPAAPKPIGRVLQSAKFKLAGVGTLIEELVRRSDEVDEELAGELAERLREMAEELEAMLPSAQG